MYGFNDLFLIRKEEKDSFLLFNYKTYQCYLLNEVGYNVVKGLCSSNAMPPSKVGLTDEEMSSFVITLFSAGIIKTDEENKESKLEGSKEIHSSYTELRSPIRVTWLITNRCNISCKHCYIGASPSNESTELPFAQIKGILRKLADAGVFIIYFTGGEPFVRQDFMDILKETSDLGLKVGISTNGIINDEIVSQLAKFSVFRAQISLDGASKETHEFIRGPGTFERTVDVIKKLVKNGIDIGITFVCHKGNVHELKDVIQLAARLRVKGIKISPLMAWGRAKDELNEYIPPFKFRAELARNALLISKREGVNLLDELHIDVGMPEENPYGCPLIMGMTLLPDAKVIPCEVFGESLSPYVILGNLKNQTVEEIWHSPKAKFFRCAASVVNKANCIRCPHLLKCGSYCLAEMYVKYKKLTPPREHFRECGAMWRNIDFGAMYSNIMY